MAPILSDNSISVKLYQNIVIVLVVSVGVNGTLKMIA